MMLSRLRVKMAYKGCSDAHIHSTSGCISGVYVLESIFSVYVFIFSVFLCWSAAIYWRNK